MRAEEVTLEKLFSETTELIAPSFHRPYEWSESACTRVLKSVANTSEELTYQGALVTLMLGGDGEGHTRALLIDGNHRLLTVLMFLLAVRDTCEQDLSDVRNTVDACCFLNANGRPKNIPTRRDRRIFEAYVSGFAPNDLSNTPLGRVYCFARDAFANAPCTAREAALTRMMQQFTFVVLRLERHEDPYPVFKLFNAPGVDFTRRGLAEYTQFAADPDLMAWVAAGESQELEFKERTINRDKTKDGQAVGAGSIVRSVAGFMNSISGGTVLVGVRDDGTIRGIESEYAEVDHGKKNWDGYQLFLSNMLRARLTTENSFLYYTLECRTTDRHDVCSIHVKPAGSPVYVDKRFYLRTNNQTIEMLGPDLVNYVATRWP